jgi:hypothetical protein
LAAGKQEYGQYRGPPLVSWRPPPFLTPLEGSLLLRDLVGSFVILVRPEINHL